MTERLMDRNGVWKEPGYFEIKRECGSLDFRKHDSKLKSTILSRIMERHFCK